MNSEFIDPEYQLNLSGGSDSMYILGSGKVSLPESTEKYCKYD